MARILPALTSKFQSGAFVAAQIIEIELPEQFNSLNGLYLTDAPFSFSYDSPTAFDTGSNTYLSSGDLMGVSDNKETGELQVSNMTMTFSALNTTYRDILCKSAIVNKKVNVFRVYFDESTLSAVATPLLLFKGKISGYSISDAERQAQFVIEVASQFVNFNRTNGMVTNEGSLKRYDKNSKAFEFAHKTDEQIFWGRKS
jgi:hypothetical protein